MPLILPKNLPACDILEKENVFVMNSARAATQDIRPLRILAVNLMPTKVATETQLARVLANTPLQVELTLLHTGTHVARHTAPEHLAAFYKNFEDIENECFDGMIITGAPVENMPFEDVDYWQELCRIMEFSKTQVYSTLHLCWGAQAALYYHYDIPKVPLAEKMFGVFEHRVLQPNCPLLRGFDEVFYAPHSRHTEIDARAVAKCNQLEVLCTSDKAGIYLLTDKNGRRIFVTGHPEYDRNTLNIEYKRDVDKGLNITVPENYYKNDNPKEQPIFRWRSHANLLYTNWLNYYVYQNTPYDLTKL
ncbi:MAG: homoserine O-succinyltransferase [Oscillospiraceae bacterium]